MSFVGLAEKIGMSCENFLRILHAPDDPRLELEHHKLPSFPMRAHFCDDTSSRLAIVELSKLAALRTLVMSYENGAIDRRFMFLQGVKAQDAKRARGNFERSEFLLLSDSESERPGKHFI